MTGTGVSAGRVKAAGCQALGAGQGVGVGHEVGVGQGVLVGIGVEVGTAVGGIGVGVAVGNKVAVGVAVGRAWALAALFKVTWLHPLIAPVNPKAIKMGLVKCLARYLRADFCVGFIIIFLIWINA